MVIVLALVPLFVLACVVAANWYLWRRLFRDTTRGPGPVRRAGVILITGGWLMAIAAFLGPRAGVPFWLQRILAWPGFLWLALSLYLLLAVLVTEPLRPVLHRLLGRSAAREAEPGRAERTDVAHAPASAAKAGSGSGAAEAGSGRAPARDVRAGTGSCSVAEAQTVSEEVSSAGEESSEGKEPSAGKESSAAGKPALLQGPTRRLFVSRMVAGAAAAAAVGTVGYGTYGVLRGPRVKRVTVPLAKLPRSAHGFRIAVVSDVHLGPILGRGFAQKVVDTINATQPDLIAVVGDLVDGTVKDLGPAAAPLAGLRARHGAYFVTGNHEYFSGAEQWVEEVRRLGLIPLENARTELPGFDLAGVNDVQGEREGQGPDHELALGDRDPARACVLLAHQPVQIHEAVRYDVDLQLSGHTHGGQLWPGTFLAAAANPTVAGLERYGDTQLYVTQGAGAWGPPTRVGAPSDITVIELASRQT